MAVELRSDKLIILQKLIEGNGRYKDFAIRYSLVDLNKQTVCYFRIIAYLYDQKSHGEVIGEDFVSEEEAVKQAINFLQTGKRKRRILIKKERKKRYLNWPWKGARGRSLYRY